MAHGVAPGSFGVVGPLGARALGLVAALAACESAETAGRNDDVPDAAWEVAAFEGAPPHPRMLAPSAWSATTHAALADLQRATLFATSGIGFSGEPSPLLVAARTIAAQPEAVPAFAWLFANGGPVSRLFAYWGLRGAAPALALTAADLLQTDDAPIRAASGCIFYESTVAQTARELEGRPALRPLRPTPPPPPPPTP